MELKQLVMSSTASLGIGKNGCLPYLITRVVQAPRVLTVNGLYEDEDKLVSVNVQ